MPTVIEIRGLRYRYPDGTLALDGVDFQLKSGECVAIFGANGSGKTTLALHLNGLLAGEGSVRICGIALGDRPSQGALAEVRTKLGMVFQDPDEQLFMPTVREDVTFGPLNLGLTREAAESRALHALQQVGMSHALDRAPYHLSAGEKRRVALAGVLAMEPEILVLDEPTTFLDPPGRRDLLRILRELPQAKLLLTHDTHFANALATRAVFLEQGRVAGEGSVEEILVRFDWRV